MNKTVSTFNNNIPKIDQLLSLWFLKNNNNIPLMALGGIHGDKKKFFYVTLSPSNCHQTISFNPMLMKIPQKKYLKQKYLKILM